MHIKIKTLPGGLYHFCVDKTDPVKSLKDKICYRFGIIQEQQRLIFNGNLIDDKKTFSEYSMYNNSEIMLILDLIKH